ncbi:SPOR domain-containing protein [Sinimarinibacterium flocculans]|mgnify:CR=1 FL=1|uniref:Cell division septation protein DedD n=1 Tax=Sinimarinibacterium flocculans TaxID=985250 RepID=A0A318EGX2_9GAMM|nr:SPOR domain-containing protein [Sinimarinibacterium flocculans]PXV71478.1 cell division septation protein DedD [Sinimarinibacterium flocculans]
MNDKLKRRLTGAAVIVLVALALAALLPEPQLAPSVEDELRVVTIPLQEEAIVETAPLDDGEAGTAGEVDSPPEIVDGDGVAPETPPAPASTPTARPTTRPTPKPSARPPATPSPSPTPAPAATATPRPTPVVTATPRPQPTAAAGADAGGEIWWVQVGSYADIGNAREAEARLAALGQTVIVAPIETASGTLYRVRAGPYTSAARAQAAHEQVVRAGMPEARLIKP